MKLRAYLPRWAMSLGLVLVGVLIGGLISYYAGSIQYHSLNSRLVLRNAMLEANRSDLHELNKRLLTEQQTNDRLEDDIHTLIAFVRRFPEFPTDEQRSPWLAIDEDVDPEEKGRLLFNKWLASYQGENIPPTVRLVDYKVDAVENVEEIPADLRQQADFIFLITYEVKPVLSFGHDWWAGNGEDLEGGWIIKSLYVMVQRQGSEYQLHCLGTGL